MCVCVCVCVCKHVPFQPSRVFDRLGKTVKTCINPTSHLKFLGLHLRRVEKEECLSYLYIREGVRNYFFHGSID